MSNRLSPGRETRLARQRVRVKPGAREDRIDPGPDGRLKVEVRARPKAGAANEAVLRLVARHLGVSRNQVRIISGHKNRDKLLEVAAASCTRSEA